MKTTSSTAINSACNEFGKLVYNKTIVDKSTTLQEIFASNLLVSDVLCKVGYQFQDINLLIRSVTHRSFIHEYSNEERKSYERLEFLGDSVLGSYTSFILFNIFTDFSEGKLSKLRSALVNEASLAKLGKFLGLDKIVLLGKGELQSQINDSLVCDLFEALLGAITLDDSINKTFEVLDRIVKSYEDETGEKFFCESKSLVFDPKTTLQEMTMKSFKSLPVYKSHKEGSEFRVELWIEGYMLLELTSHSKKLAMKELAKECIENNLLEKISREKKEC